MIETIKKSVELLKKAKLARLWLIRRHCDLLREEIEVQKQILDIKKNGINSVYY